MSAPAQPDAYVDLDQIAAPTGPCPVEGEKKSKNLKEKHSDIDIEYAEHGGGAALASDVLAVVDIHGDVIKADWDTIRAKEIEAKEYDHALGLWQAVKTYKKVPSCLHYTSAVLRAGGKKTCR